MLGWAGTGPGRSEPCLAGRGRLVATVPLRPDLLFPDSRLRTVIYQDVPQEERIY